MNWDETVEECSSGQCVAQFVLFGNGQNFGFPFCADNDTIKSPGLLFTMIFNLTFQNNFVEYEFSCNYDNCNDIAIVGNVTRIFHNAYNILSILEAFGYKDDGEGEEETTATSTKVSSAITNPVASTSASTIDNTTIEANHGLHRQSSDTIIYIAQLISIAYLLFLP